VNFNRSSLIIMLCLLERRGRKGEGGRGREREGEGGREREGGRESFNIIFWI
jgi:hypothetical protein